MAAASSSSSELFGCAISFERHYATRHDGQDDQIIFYNVKARVSYILRPGSSSSLGAIGKSWDSHRH